MFFNHKHTRTPFIQLDTNKCKACWECIKNCSNQVISKIDLPWHRHALIVEPEACTGCLKCVSLCQYNAYSIPVGANQKSEKISKRTFYNFIINNLLIISGLMIIFSGLALQLGFHMGGSDERHNITHETQSRSNQYEQLKEIDTNKIVCGLNYSDWSAVHKAVIVFFSLLMIYHTYVHWKWYKGVITKKLIHKNKQVIILSILFLLVAVTGLVPWIIDLSGSSSIFRMLFIEIHDKLTFVLIVFFVLHFIKRVKWYGTTYVKIKGFLFSLKILFYKG
ncbi:MAG: 4Fe-4S dicluster domain-containing protein [Candidatus Kapaibacterium sp.]